MVNRPAGGERSKRWDRMSLDWYIEPPSGPRQIFQCLDFGPPDNLDLLWDCCAGSGTTLDVAKEFGHETIASDVVDRKPKHRFFRGNILQITSIPKPRPGQSMSIITNSPYSYEKDIAEKIIRRCMDMPLRRAVFILPIAFLCGAGRWGFFTQEFNPSHVIIFSQRPTMPPGELMETMTSPFKGGMQDYAAIAYSFPHKWKTQMLWAKPE